MASPFFVKLTTSLVLLGLVQNSLAAQVESRIVKATDLITDFSLLNNSEEGKKVLKENLETSIRINNSSTDEQRQTAIYDNTTAALVGSMNNGLGVSDALGSRMNKIYSSKNSISKNYSSTTFSKNFEKLFSQVNTLIQSESAFAKNYLANGTSDGKTEKAEGINLPDGGIFNVYDQAYSPLEENKNSVGNSRPVQVRPNEIQSFIGKDFFGKETNSATEILPGVKTNASFPSGHSAFGFASTSLFSQLVPERYQDFIFKGSEYGNSRIVLGVHYALDVIGARIMTTHTIAQILNNNPEYLNQQVRAFTGATTTTNDFQKLMSDAGNDLRTMLESECNTTISNCVTDEEKAESLRTLRERRQEYLYRMTYGLSPIGPTNLAPVVPEGAEILLATRFPYLTPEQRREVLATTEIESGHALDDGSGWARINLFDAAGGYGSFDGDVSISMDAKKGGFNAYDIWNNDIKGSGSFEKKGSGTLELSGNNSFNGKTTVSEGGLIISGDHSHSDVTVKAGAIIKGSGSIGSLNAEARSIVATPNQDQIFTVKGDINLEKDSIYLVNANSGNIHSNGKANIDNSKLKLNLQDTVNENTFGHDYTILTADQGISGWFTYDNDDYLFIKPVITYRANDVVMNVQRNSVLFEDVATTKNQRSVAKAISDLGINNELYKQVLLSGSKIETVNAYQNLTGQIYADVSSSIFNNSRHLRDTLNQRLRQKNGEIDFSEIKHSNGTWVKPLGIWGHTSNDGNANGYKTKTYGLLLGFDKTTESDNIFGFSAGYTRTSLDGSNSNADMNNYHFGVYGSHKSNDWTVKVGGIYSIHSIDTSRTVQFYSSAPISFSPSYKAQSKQLFAELAYSSNIDTLKFEPFLNLSYTDVSTNSVNEGKHLVALKAEKQHGNAIISTQGARLDMKLDSLLGINATLKNELAWQHQFNNVDRSTKVGFNSSNSSFNVNSVSTGKDAVILKTHLAMKPSDNLELNIGYSGSKSKNSYDNSLNLGVNWSF